MMAILRQTGTNGRCEVVTEQGTVLATGTLQIELNAGAQRHGGVVFVSDERTAELAPIDLTEALAAQWDAA
jgi:hypothetical protein